MSPFSIIWWSIRFTLSRPNRFIGMCVTNASTKCQQPFTECLRAPIHRDVRSPQRIAPRLVIFCLAAQPKRVGTLRSRDVGHDLWSSCGDQFVHDVGVSERLDHNHSSFHCAEGLSKDCGSGTGFVDVFTEIDEQHLVVAKV